MKIKRLTEDSIVARALAWLAAAVIRYRGWFLYPQVVLFVACSIFTFYCIKSPGGFDVNRDDLVGAEKTYHQNFLRFKKEFPTQDDLVVVVESEDPERNRQFVERLGPRLERQMVGYRNTNGVHCTTNLFHDILYKGDLKMLGSKALLFAPEADLKDLKSTLKDYRPFVEQFTKTTNLVSLFDMLNTQFRTAKREESAETDSLLKALPALDRIIDQATASLHRVGTPPSPGVVALFNPDEDAQQQIYITFAKGRIYLLTAQAPNEDLNGEAVERMRQLIDQTKAEVPGLSVGFTGEPVLEYDEMAQSQKDTTVASVASLLICALIFIYGYQETGRPVKATLCLIVGLAYTLAFAFSTVGHLNILTITFVPILIGLAIDYGVHLISRFEEELRRGRDTETALTKAMVYTGQGILTGGFTTAGAFLAMAFTDFKGIQEMGIICGGGLLICLVPMMTMLPVLLLRGRQNSIDHDHADLAVRRARIENIWLNRPVAVTAITLALCILAATQLSKVFFDYNLLHMQSKGLPAVETEQRLIDSADKSVLYAAIIATNLQHAAALEQQITNLPAVTNVESITRFLSENQTGKLAVVGEIKSELGSVAFNYPDTNDVNLPELSRTLYSFFGYLGAANEEVQKDNAELSKQLLSLRESVGELRHDMLSGDPVEREANSRKLAQFQRALFDDVRETFEGLQNQDNSSPLRVEDLPQSLRDRFVGITGKYLIMVYPKHDVWQREYQKELIDQLEKIDPAVTGTPIQLYHYTELLKTSYEKAAYYSLIAIVILVFVHFRSPLAVALTLVPVGVGFVWLSGLMGALHIPLNPANIMTLPLVIGIGVTNGIHILNRFAEEQTPNILARSTGKAVLVSGLTAMAGFGSLILAKHQGIKSLGYVMSTGLATCMIAGLTFLPALLNLLLQRRQKTNRPSGDNAQSTLGREEPR